jgi:hypothetical protein
MDHTVHSNSTEGKEVVVERLLKGDIHIFFFDNKYFGKNTV